MEDNDIERVCIQEDNAKQTHKSLERQNSSLQALLKARSECTRDRWSGSPKKIPFDLFALSPTLSRPQSQALYQNLGSAGFQSMDSLLSLPRRKKSPRRGRKCIDLYIPPSDSEGGRNAEWGITGVISKSEVPDRLFFDKFRLDVETQPTPFPSKQPLCA